MHDIVDRLPIRVASLAGLVVGGVSLAGGASLPGAIERIAIAMVIFGAIGALLKLLIQKSAQEQGNELGTNLDAFTPEMTADDLGLGGFGDRGEIS